MNEPLQITTIVISYNHSSFIRERIESILRQTRKPDEIILLDDASSDNTVEIAKEILDKSSIKHRIVVNKHNTGQVFKQWLKGIELASYSLIWIAEGDDSADVNFIENLIPAFFQEDVIIAYGHMEYIDQKGNPTAGLEHYYSGCEVVSWAHDQYIPAYTAFTGDFALKNVIPNVSGVMFRKPFLHTKEKERLCKYKFAGDWYFYALISRGGTIAYRHSAKSYFRIVSNSVSRKSFFTHQHLYEHQMIIHDLKIQYGINDISIKKHAQFLNNFFPNRSIEDIYSYLNQSNETLSSYPLRICIIFLGFMIGGGEVLPIELANKLKEMGHHITVMVLEEGLDLEGKRLRKRLRSDIPLMYWSNIHSSIDKFIEKYGIQIINSHNIGVENAFYQKYKDIKTKYVVSLHGGYEYNQSLLKDSFIDFIKKQVDAWLYLAEKNKNILLKNSIPLQKIIQSFNAVPDSPSPLIDRNTFRREAGIPIDSFCLVICSRAVEDKGWKTAIDICLRLNLTIDKNIYLFLIGEGPMEESLRKVYGDIKYIRFMGYIDRPIRYFDCFDLGIFPSTFPGESAPLFLLECFKAGLPVVSTNIGEIPNMVGKNQSIAGVLVPADSSSLELVKKMADEIKKIIYNHEYYNSLKKNAKILGEKYNMNKLAEFYTSIFNSLL